MSPNSAGIFGKVHQKLREAASERAYKVKYFKLIPSIYVHELAVVASSITFPGP